MPASFSLGAVSPALLRLPVPMAGADVAFFVLFGVFVVAFVVLSVITMRWAVRQDRVGRAQWIRRRSERAAGDRDGRPASGDGDGDGEHRANGRRPRGAGRASEPPR